MRAGGFHVRSTDPTTRQGPLAEPVAWYGPIVMNTQEQLRRAFDELERGTFLETKGRG